MPGIAHCAVCCVVLFIYSIVIIVHVQPSRGERLPDQFSYLPTGAVRDDRRKTLHIFASIAKSEKAKQIKQIYI